MRTILKPSLPVEAANQPFLARAPWLNGIRLVWLALTLLALAVFLYAASAYIGQQSQGYVGVLLAYTPAGEVILRPEAGTPAAEAGIQDGEILLAVDGQPVVASIQGRIARYGIIGPAGEAVVLTVRSAQNEARDVTVIRRERGPLPFGLSARAFAIYLALWDLALVLGYQLVALLLVLRKGHDPFAMLVACALVIIPIRIPPEMEALNSLQPHWMPLTIFLSILGYSAIPLVFSRFPNGRFVPRWSPVYVVLAVAAGTLIHLIMNGFLPALAGIALPLDRLVITAGFGLQVYRYRQISTPLEKQQTRWVVFGMALAVTGFYVYAILPGWLPNVETYSPGSYLYHFVARPLSNLAILAVPVTLLVSMLRYRLWEIDLIIRRTLIYSALTGTLLVVYLISVVSLQTGLQAFINASDQISVMLSTLTVAALFHPLRKRIQHGIDKRFFRRRYDTEAILGAFAERIQNEVDLETLQADLVQTVQETIQPEQASLVLIHPQQQPPSPRLQIRQE